jgi:hypothetical protein
MRGKAYLISNGDDAALERMDLGARLRQVQTF